MPSERYQRLDPAKRAKIVEAAGRELAAEGYDNASLNRILAAAGISKSTAYYYFKDKADLCATVLETMWHDVEPVADELTKKTFWPRLMKLHSEQFRLFAKEPWRWGLAKALNEFMRRAKHDPAMAARFEPIAGVMQGILSKGQALGVVRRDLPEPLLIALVSAVDSTGDAWFLEQGPNLTHDEVDAVAEKLQAILKQILSPPR